MRWEEAIKNVSLFGDFVCFLTEHLAREETKKNICHYTVNMSIIFGDLQKYRG